MTTSLLVIPDTLDVMGDTFARTISLLNLINGKKMSDSLVSEPLDDVPHMLPLEVDRLEFAISLSSR
jgi:hypothetical protein